MKISLLYRLVYLFLLGMLLGACQKVVVTVDTIPANTPVNQPIFIVGNFNDWDPGDERYQMQMNDDSVFTIELPPGFGTMEYKFTRGDWTTVEKDICGYEIENRRIIIGDDDTVVNQIASWNDLDPLNCPRMTVLLKNIPEGTPEQDIIAIAGNFNSWAADSASTLKKDSLGNYSITIARPPQIEEIEFKVTRGDLASAESDEFGNMVPNRVLRFGVKDTVEIKVEGWIDRPDKKGNRVVFIVKDLPRNTPSGAELFLASSMNGWNGGDRNYQFQRNRQGDLFFPVPRRKKPIEFKITRGDWSSVEVDRFGFEIDNRYVNLVEADTVYLSVKGWKDLSAQSDYNLTVVIDELPPNTPDNPDIFISGNFNGWRAGRTKFRFSPLSNGAFFVDVPRGRGELVFKVNRGSWDAAEVDEYGSDISNRVYPFSDYDTLYITVKNWKDLPPFSLEQVTLVIDGIPENTPETDNLFFVPDYNGWNPEDPKQVFYYLPDGRPYITILAREGVTEYKITRGGWSTVEVDKEGQNIPNRVLNYGFADTVYIEVIAWRDFSGSY